MNFKSCLNPYFLAKICLYSHHHSILSPLNPTKPHERWWNDAFSHMLHIFLGFSHETARGFLKWGYPQFSSISRWDFPVQNHPFGGTPFQETTKSLVITINHHQSSLTIKKPPYIDTSIFQWEFQDPKMEVLYHIRLYFGAISPYIALT